MDEIDIALSSLRNEEIFELEASLAELSAKTRCWGTATRHHAKKGKDFINKAAESCVTCLKSAGNDKNANAECYKKAELFK